MVVGADPVSEVSGRSYLARELAIVPSSGGSDGTHRFGQAVDFLLDDGTGREREVLTLVARPVQLVIVAYESGLVSAR